MTEGSEGFCIYEKNWSIFFDFLVTQETLDPISIENNRILPGEVNLNLTSVLCTIQK